MNDETLKDLVAYCGGDVNKIEKWKEEIETTPITTIEELIKYPFKVHYIYIISKDKAPNLRRIIFDDNDSFDRYQTITLDLILDILHENETEENIKLVEKELIDLKFGTMEYDW